MAEFARAWDALIGGRIIGITTAENAAQVMADGEEVRWTPGPAPHHDGHAALLR